MGKTGRQREETEGGKERSESKRRSRIQKRKDQPHSQTQDKEERKDMQK